MPESDLGNVYTGVDIGGQLRFGYKMPRTFQNINIGPVAYGAPIKKGLYAYLFTGVQGRAVLRDIFLDGNTFVDSPHTVDKETFVGEFRIGTVLGYNNWELQVLFAHRTRQFEDQKKKHKFGQITVSYTPDF
jgi:hypothetical protein